MQLFLKKLLIFIFLVFVIDKSLGFILKELYFSVPRKLTYAIRDTNEDILIYGSSRGSRHYNPKIFEDKLGLSCFNNGLDGRNIYFHYALLQSAIERHTPKLVILDLLSADYTITNSDWDTDRLNVLLPFYNENKYISEVVNLRSRLEKIKLFSSIYPFNSALVEIIKTSVLNKDKSYGYNGYLPKKEIKVLSDRVDRIFLDKEDKPDLRKMEYLKKMIQTCRNTGIPLVVIISPWFCSNSQETRILEEITSDNQIPLWNFSHLVSFDKESLFFNSSHLNETGANLFSDMIAKKIKKDIITNE